MKRTAIALLSSSLTIKLAPRRDHAGDYVVKVTRHGVRTPEADYYTNDWDDAVKTASHMWTSPAPVADSFSSWYATQVNARMAQRATMLATMAQG